MRFSIASSGSEMGARDELRRLLRQRLEDGETTIVLESLTATEVTAALKLSGEAQIPRVARDDKRARDDTRGEKQIARGVHPEEQRDERTQDDMAARDDKRETLEQRRSIPAEGSG